MKRHSTNEAVSLLGRQAPRIMIARKTLAKMNAYVANCKYEIGWLGFVTKSTSETGRTVYTIDDVFLPKQDVHEATTEIQSETFMEICENLMDNDPDKYDALSFWGHSHVDMAPNPSGQDDDQMEVFASGKDFFIRYIANKSGIYKISLFDYETGVKYDNLMLYTEEEFPEIEAQIREEIKAKVKEIKIEKKSTGTVGTANTSNRTNMVTGTQQTMQTSTAQNTRTPYQGTTKVIATGNNLGKFRAP